jgi:hypothetical protein
LADALAGAGFDVRDRPDGTVIPPDQQQWRLNYDKFFTLGRRQSRTDGYRITLNAPEAWPQARSVVFPTHRATA